MVKKIRLEEEWRRAEHSPDTFTERDADSTSLLHNQTPNSKLCQKSLYLTLHLGSFPQTSESRGGAGTWVKRLCISWQEPEMLSYSTYSSTFGFLCGEIQSSFLEITFRILPKWETRFDHENVTYTTLKSL